MRAFKIFNYVGEPNTTNPEHESYFSGMSEEEWDDIDNDEDNTNNDDDDF